MVDPAYRWPDAPIDIEVQPDIIESHYQLSNAAAGHL